MSDPRIRVTQRGDAGEREILDALDAPTIRIALGEDAGRSDVQLITLALVDMLGRVFPRIDVTGDLTIATHAVLPPGPGMLGERVDQVRSHGTQPLASGAPSVTVGIGGFDGPADVYVDGEGWDSYVGTRPSDLSPAEGGGGAVPVGALAAACRVAARTFAAAMAGMYAGAPPPESAYSSTLTYAVAPRPLDEPTAVAVGRLEAVLVGAGSVGGAAVYTLARAPGLAGELDVVDPQALEPGNFDRALLAPRPVASQRPDKAQVAVEALAHLNHQLTARQHRKTIEQFVADRPREATLPLVLCAVDSARSRRALQDCLPLEVINAACWPREIAVSRHITDDGPCVYCLHMPDVMNADTIRARLIARATGINYERVVVMLAQHMPLDAQALRFIETRTGRPPNSLQAYEGRLLDELWRDQLLYGAARVRTEGGTVAEVAAPWVTTLAGVLLAGEAIKASAPDVYAAWRLGPEDGSPAIKYAENPYASPLDRLLLRPQRWRRDECLCGSPRRLALLHSRYPHETS